MSKHKWDSSHFINGLLWNYSSMIVLAVGGIMFNALIVLFYDVATLGLFNQVYAYYIVISQISVFGIHSSVLKYLSNTGQESSNHILASAVLSVLAISLVVTSITYLVCKSLINDDRLIRGMISVLPAYTFFPLTKLC